MMRVALVAATLAGCTGDPADTTPLVGGALVGLAEGEVVVRTLAQPAPSAQLPPWVTIDRETLVIAPGCDVVRGFEGAPQLFTIELANGTDPVQIQVQPTIAGACVPRVKLCVTDKAQSIDCLTDDQFRDQTLGEVALSVAYLSPSDPVELLYVQLFDPDRDPESPLEARLSNDGPLPSITGDAARLAAVSPIPLPNHDIAGDFRLFYEIALAGQSARRLATGTYRLQWNRDKQPEYGVEVEWCVDPSTGGPCSYRRTDAGWRLCRMQPSATLTILPTTSGPALSDAKANNSLPIVCIWPRSSVTLVASRCRKSCRSVSVKSRIGLSGSRKPDSA